MPRLPPINPPPPQDSTPVLMECLDSTVSLLSWTLSLGGVAYLLQQTRFPARYGRYVRNTDRCCSSRLGWFLQEVPAFLLPLLLLLLCDVDDVDGSGRTLLICTFMLHYFHRSFIYAALTRGRPIPVAIVVYSAVFCSLNGFLQGHFLLHCFQLERTWLADARLCAGICLFAVGMIINISSDRILRRLRKPGEITYSIPRGGMFDFVSGANYLGEIVEWCGYAVATWSFPTFSFAFFTVCSIGPRAYKHHRFYQQKFKDYPCSRKALIPFLLFGPWGDPPAQYHDAFHRFRTRRPYPGSTGLHKAHV